jgi:hypothetical protein
MAAQPISPIRAPRLARLAWLAWGLCALASLFAPLRSRVRAFIDRRFYRRKYDAARTLADFAATARDETDLEALTARLVDVVQETMEPESVKLWLRPHPPPRPLPDNEWGGVPKAGEGVRPARNAPRNAPRTFLP